LLNGLFLGDLLVFFNLHLMFKLKCLLVNNHIPVLRVVSVFLVGVELNGDIVGVFLVMGHGILLLNEYIVIVVGAHKLSDGLAKELSLKENWVLTSGDIIGVLFVIVLKKNFTNGASCELKLRKNWVLSIRNVIIITLMVE
jgi:hypothetical protein